MPSMRRLLKAFPGGPPKEAARHADTAGVADGVVTSDELRALKARVDAGEPGWDERKRKGLAVAARMLGVDTSAFVTPWASPSALGPNVNVSVLNGTQRAVLQNTRSRAEVRSAQAHAAVMEMAARTGFTEAEVNTALEAIRTRVPLTINFRPDKRLPEALEGGGSYLIDAFLRQGRYKNQFETNITSGVKSATPGGERDGWEQALFEGGYHGHPLIPEERPKYGAMNAELDPLGGACGYGRCYFVLSDHMRERSTFTCGDSSRCEPGDLGTAEHFEHVLADMRDPKFTRVMNALLGRDFVRPPPEDFVDDYVEMQVHGPISFATDISGLVADVAYLGTAYEVKLRVLAERARAQLSWTDGARLLPGDAPTP